MKHTATLTLLIALALGAGTAFATDKMGDMDMKNMDMKNMDMGKQKMGEMKSMDMGGKQAMAGTTHQGVGVVKEFDAKAGKVTLDHQPVKSLNWPAMSMAFAVKDKALLDKLAVGKKVKFEFVKEGGGYRLTGVK